MTRTKKLQEEIEESENDDLTGDEVTLRRSSTRIHTKEDNDDLNEVMSKSDHGSCGSGSSTTSLVGQRYQKSWRKEMKNGSLVLV